MNILDVKLKTLLSYVKNKHSSNVIFQQFSDGGGSIIVYNEDNQSIILSWTNEDERETKLMEYIFLNKV